MLALSSGRRLALDWFDWRSNHVRYSIAAAGVLATVITFGTSREPPAPQTGFMDRWSAVPMRVVPMPVKQVRTQSFVQSPVNPALPEIDGFLTMPMPPIKTQERPPDNPPPRIKAVEPEEKSSRILARADLKGPDICRGKGRIITRGGKSWRCRR